MNKTDLQNAILAALKKLGPSSPVQIANSIGEEPETVRYTARALIAEGRIKATGATMSRRYALPGQRLAGDPGTKATKPKVWSEAPTPAAGGATLGEFIPAMTVGGEFVIVHRYLAEKPQIFTEGQAHKLAELLLQHYEA